MKKKKQYEHPAMIVVKLSGKDGFMDAASGPVEVRGYRGEAEWDEE